MNQTYIINQPIQGLEDQGYRFFARGAEDKKPYLTNSGTGHPTSVIELEESDDFNFMNMNLYNIPASVYGEGLSVYSYRMSDPWAPEVYMLFDTSGENILEVPEQPERNYRVRIQKHDPNTGSWVNQVEIIGTLPEITDWASDGRNSFSVEADGRMSYCAPSELWVDDEHDKVLTPELEPVAPVSDDNYAPYGYMWFGESNQNGATNTIHNDPDVKLIRVYPPLGNEDYLPEGKDYYEVWAHPEPLEFSLDLVEKYINLTCALDPESERVIIEEVPPHVASTEDIMMQYSLDRYLNGTIEMPAEVAEAHRNYFESEYVR